MNRESQFNTCLHSLVFTGLNHQQFIFIITLLFLKKRISLRQLSLQQPNLNKIVRIKYISCLTLWTAMDPPDAGAVCW